MVDTILIVSNILMILGTILLLIGLFCTYRVFKLLIESVYECNSNINYIKSKLEETKLQGKHQKLFEKEG